MGLLYHVSLSFPSIHQPQSHRVALFLLSLSIFHVAYNLLPARNTSDRQSSLHLLGVGGLIVISPGNVLYFAKQETQEEQKFGKSPGQYRLPFGYTHNQDNSTDRHLYRGDRDRKDQQYTYCRCSGCIVPGLGID